MQTLSPLTDLTTIYNLFGDHVGILFVIAGIVLLYKYLPSIGLFFKQWSERKSENESKWMIQLKDLNEKHFQLYDKSNQGVENISKAISSFEKALLVMEHNTSEKITSSESRITERISEVEVRISDQITTATKDIALQNKLDRISTKEIDRDHCS